ncbi:uncharacterized protein LOC135440007 isoform X4 [Drosophila montana]|uniref:uncharacterized protein LOC135440007 isoform X4 n=1 Tax=Drosophila montana TaxID=40370 RepID=UPI00313BC2A2
MTYQFVNAKKTRRDEALRQTDRQTCGETERRTGLVPESPGQVAQEGAHEEGTGSAGAQCTAAELQRGSDTVAGAACQGTVSGRAQRSKRIAKAIERQARKLRLKGLDVNVEQLRADYLAAHRNDIEHAELEQDDELPIDVVGVCSDSLDNSRSHSSNLAAALTNQRSCPDNSCDGSAVIKLEPLEPLEALVPLESTNLPPLPAEPTQPPPPPPPAQQKPQHNSCFSIESLLGT